MSLNKIRVFEKELNLIKNHNYRKVAAFMLSKAPDYFFEIPASSTGKYHPLVNQGKGGLVRHVKLAIAVATDSFRLERFSFSNNEKDLILISLLMHDIYKSGKNPTADEIFGSKTDFEHPRLAVEFVRDCNQALQKNNMTSFSIAELEFVCGCVEAHMGQWNTREGHEDLPKPTTPAQLCVSNADYMASRRFYDASYLDLLKEKGYYIRVDEKTNQLLTNVKEREQES